MAGTEPALRVVARVAQLPAWTVALTALATVLAASLIAGLFGGAVVPTPVYALMVGATGLVCRRWVAVAVAAVAVLSALAVDLWLVDVPSSDVTVAAANTVLRFCWLVAFGVGANLVRTVVDALVALTATDGLTGLLNARGFRERASIDIERARRSGRPLTLVYFDLDGLKAVNDGEGHRAGDRLIVDFAGCLDAVRRQADWAGRIGGDEFALLLVDTDRRGAASLLERLAHSGAPAASAGGVTWQGHPPDVEDMLAAADAAMYEAKAGSGGPVLRSAGRADRREVVTPVG